MARGSMPFNNTRKRCLLIKEPRSQQRMPSGPWTEARSPQEVDMNSQGTHRGRWRSPDCGGVGGGDWPVLKGSPRAAAPCSRQKSKLRGQQRLSPRMVASESTFTVISLAPVPPHTSLSPPDGEGPLSGVP